MTRKDHDALLDAALSHVPFEGMNDRALTAGARDLNISIDLARVYFPQGGAGLAAAYHRRADALLRESLTQTPPGGRFRERVAEAIWRRLMLVDSELVRAGAATLGLPQNAALAARLIWETADTIWIGLGDRSTDVNWYTKRATLSAVISATVLFWLGDDSDDHVETRGFIDRRIDGVMQVESVKSSLRKLPGAERLAAVAFGWIRAPQARGLPGRARP